MTALPLIAPPLRRLNKIRVRREIELKFNLHHLVKEGHIIRPNRVPVEHLRVAFDWNVELVAKGRKIERLKLVNVDNLLRGAIDNGENVTYRGGRGIG